MPVKLRCCCSLFAQAKHAQEAGVDAISCVGPSYHKPETIGNSYIAFSF